MSCPCVAHSTARKGAQEVWSRLAADAGERGGQVVQPRLTVGAVGAPVLGAELEVLVRVVLGRGHVDVVAAAAAAAAAAAGRREHVPLATLRHAAREGNTAEEHAAAHCGLDSPVLEAERR
eukprot:3760522-Prymnesium_polylepis.3